MSGMSNLNNLHPYEYGGFLISPGYPGKPVVITRGGFFFRFAKDCQDAERQIRVYNHQEIHMDIRKATNLDGGHREGTLFIPFSRMVEVLGQPHRNGEPDYPDDEAKTDVCWQLFVEDQPVVIWNYKNGPAYNHCGKVEDIAEFSVFADPETIKKLQAALA